MPAHCEPQKPMKRRLWKTWPKRLRSEFNEVGGFLAVVGFALAVAPFTHDKPTEHPWLVAVIVLAGLGGVVACVAAISKSWPEAIRPISDVYGKTIRLEEVATLDPPPLRIGIVGPSYSGKSTLMHRIAALPLTNERTVGVFAMVVQMPTLHNRAVALIDGGGQYYTDQFRVAEDAEVLIVVIDHNQSETEKRLSDVRMDEHRQFARQLREKLKKGAPKKLIVLLANKADIWRDISPEETAKFRAYIAEQHQVWASANLAQECVVAEHSNMSAEDMTVLTRVLGKVG